MFLALFQPPKWLPRGALNRRYSFHRRMMYNNAHVADIYYHCSCNEMKRWENEEKEAEHDVRNGAKRKLGDVIN